MRTVATGFVLGYFVIAILVVPALLWGLQMTPTYSSGILVVLDRTGVLGPVEDTAKQVVDLRDRMRAELTAYVEKAISRRISN
jgi:hypothetical protein